MWRYERTGSPPTNRDDRAEIDERDHDRAEESCERAGVSGSARDRSRPRLAAASTGLDRRATAGHEQPDLVDVGGCAASNDADDLALVHHVDPVGQGEELVELLGDQQDRRAASRELEQQPVDGLDGPDVQAAGRLDGDEQRRLGSISRARIARWRLPPDRSRTCVSIEGAETA